MLRRDNCLDTRTAGSYNRRPLSLGTLVPGMCPQILVLASRDLYISRWSSKGIYGDDDPIDPDRPK
jgi:hypothetical protein